MKYIFIILLNLICMTAHAVVFNLVVPFDNVSLNFGDRIQAVYNFSTHPMIFCYTNNQNTAGLIAWPYLGRNVQSTLPVFLKINAAYEGFFADPIGTISVLNNVNATIIASCDFGF